MIDIAIVRVVGNELPPRDPKGSKIQALRFVLENENLRGVPRAWVVNRIINKEYKKLIYKILEGETTTEIPFITSEYKKCQTFYEKIVYSCNLNGGRLGGMEFCKNHRFLAVLDQDCYYTEQEWKKIVEFIEKDQSNFDTKYYLTATKRIHIDNIPVDLNEVPDDEPMIIFRNDAELTYDPNVRFGDDNKRKLLRKLGVEANIREHKITITSDIVKMAGNVCHIAFGDEMIEKDVDLRVKIRQESLDRLISTIENIPLI
jgi:hypothetical protein